MRQIVTVRLRSDYLQIRYLGIADKGMELVRVERSNGKIKVVSDQEFQAKGDRHYKVAMKEAVT